MQRLAPAVRAALAGFLAFAACCVVDMLAFDGASSGKGVFAGPVLAGDDDDDD